MSTVPHTSRGPVVYGVTKNEIIWPTRSQPYADAMPRPGTLPPPNTTGLLFDADIPRYGLARYEQNNIANNAAVLDVDYGICADPAGSGTIVAWCDNVGGKTNTNEFARSQMLTKRWIYPALRDDNWGNYANYAAYYIDPNATLATTSDWVTIQGFHGPPFIGPSSTGLMVVFDPPTQTHYLRVGDVVGRVPKTTTVPIGKWFQVLTLFRYSTAEEGGWVDLYINQGMGLETGWERIPVEGGYRKPFSMISDEEGNAWLTDPTRGPTYSGWGCYGNHRATIYCAAHRLGTTAASVMPSGWSGTIAGVSPDTLWGTTPAPEPTTYTPNPSNGKNGEFTDTLANSYTSGSLTSLYHIRASHLTGPGPYPLIIHLHGDGYEEYTHMAAGTANSVANQYAQVAKDTEALFVLPRTPDTATGTWWEKMSSTTWLMALYDHIVGRYNIDLNRVYWSGYSGGAEEISYNVVADYNNRWTGGGAMILGGGGAEGMTGFAVTPTAAFKTNFPMHWHVGALDSDDGTGWSALNASQGGENWYKGRGFTTTRTLIPLATHVPSEVHGPRELQTLIADSHTAYGLPRTPDPRDVNVTGSTARSVPASTTDKSVAVSAARTTGDLLVFLLAVYGTEANAATLPAGFTKLAERTRGTNHRLIIGTRTVTSNDPATYTPTIPTGVTMRADLHVIQGANTTSTPLVSITETSAATTHPAPSITPTTNAGLLLNAVTGTGGNTWRPHSWLVEHTDLATPSPFLTLSTASQPILSTAPSGTRTFTASSGSYTHLTASVFIPAQGSTAPATNTPEATPLPQTPARRAVVLGTSHSDTTWTESGGVWWWQLAADRAGLTVLDCVAVGGQDTQGALTGWDGATPQIVKAENSGADLAILEFGGNDANLNVTPDDYGTRLTELINRLKAKGMRTVIVFPPVLFADMGAAFDTKYRALRDRARTVASATGSYYTDAWGTMTDPATGWCREAYNVGDDMHFNGEGQKAFADGVAADIQAFAAVTNPYDGVRDAYWYDPATTVGDASAVQMLTNPNDALFRGEDGALISSGTADTSVFHFIGSDIGGRYEISYAYRVETGSASNGGHDVIVDWPGPTQTARPPRHRITGVEGVRRHELTIPPEATDGRTFALTVPTGLTGYSLRISRIGVRKL